MSKVLGYLFLPTELLRDAGTSIRNHLLWQGRRRSNLFLRHLQSFYHLRVKLNFPQFSRTPSVFVGYFRECR
jgi:hypothetical protein